MESRLSPAFGVALAAAGFMIGVVALRLVPGLGRTPAGPAPVGAAVVSAPPVANVLSLESAAGSGQVRLSYDTSERSQMEGSVADPQIRALLVATVRDSLNAGFRLEAIDALSQHTGHEEVRAALLDALRLDANPGARLRAIDALGGRVDSDAGVRRAMLDAVHGDANPGVRVRAIDFLARGRDRDLLPEMERLASEDPDAYVRMRSAGFVDAVHAGDRR
jgi:HEAT repeat protein